MGAHGGLRPRNARDFEFGTAIEHVSVVMKGSVMQLTPPTEEPNPTAADPNASRASSATGERGLDMLRDVEVELTLEIGRRRMKIADVLKLGPGQTLELDKQAGEPLELLVNGRLIGRGEAVVVGDRYGIRITEIVSTDGGAR